MFFQLILSFALLSTLFYAVSIRARASLLSSAAFLVCSIALYFVWFPEHTNRIAHLLGIGRGADLLFYCWVVISLILLLNLHLKLRIQNERLTALVRSLALNEAKKLD